MYFNRLIVLIVAASVLTAPATIAQTITGSITGTVTDATGALVPNANVSAVNVNTNITNSGVSNDAGIYNIRFLPTGEYRVEVTTQGFKKAVLGPFRVEVGQVARLDVSLEVGEVTQSVEVSAVAPILQTETTQTGETISANTATSLPLQGRNFSSLTLLVPGSVTPAPDEFNSAARQNGRPFVNGNREQTNNFLLDGADINEHMDNGIGYAPNVDAIAEVRVITGNASAEYGNANGAIVNMTMKSGTNEFHGNVFEFLRNEKFDANTFFLNRQGQSKRALRRNIFGGTFGGPIVKDKLFFFVDYQGTKERTSGPVLASVAPAAFRTGDLSAITRGIRDPLASGACVNRNDPGCFQNNIIPANRIANPVARALFSNQQLYPLPNRPGTGALGLTNNYAGQGRTVVDNDQADAKVDWRLSDNDQVMARFSIARFRAQNGGTVALPTQLGSADTNPTTGGVISWTRTISPTIVNEARAAFTQVGLVSSTGVDIFGILGANGNQDLGISGGQPIPGVSSIIIGEGISNIGAAATDSATTDNTFQYGDNLTIQAGRHLLKIGGQALRYQQNRFYAGNNGLLGIFTYNGVYSGSPFSDFLLDLLNSKGRGSLSGTWGHRQWRTALFFQDDMKVSSNFTLNLGLRWEYSQPIYEVADRQANIDLTTGRALLAGRDGNSRALYNPYYKQFMPRVGFAWTPAMLGNRFVVRGAYGITSYLEGTGGNLRLPLNPPYYFESNIVYDNNTPGSIQSGFADVRPLDQLSGNVRYWNPNLRPAFIQQYNFSLEYQVTNSFSLNTAYVGQKGTHLVVATEYNQPLPGTGPVSTWTPAQTRRPLYSVAPLITTISGTDSSSNMNYNSLQVSGRKRLSGGLEFITSYTLSKTLTDNRGFYGKGGFVNSESAYFQNTYDREAEYGRAFFDATHIFTLGGSYELPFGRGRKVGQNWNGVADAIAGGWTLNFVSSLRSGFPVTMAVNDQSNQLARAARPNRYKDGFANYASSVDNWFGFTAADLCLTPGVNDGTCVYGVPAAGTFGSSAKATERAPDFRNLDLSIGKRFRVSEANYFDFRAEFFNAFNHANFGPPNNNISVPGSFGQITRQVGSPRNVQFGLKYHF